MNNRFLYYFAPVFKFFVYVFFLVLWAIPFFLVSQFEFIQFKPDSLYFELYSESMLVLIILGALLMIFRVLWLNFERIFIVRQHLLSGFLKGSLIGFLLILGCAGLAQLNGNVVFNEAKIDVFMVMAYAVLYILVAIAEELLFRSFPLFIFSERYPVAIAILISSILFGLAHLGNPNFTAMAMLNITLAGILFSLLILQKRNISWAIGIHFAWNFTQGVLLGYKVSGTDSPGLFVAKPIGPIYLSAGEFGIESSVFCTALLLIIIAYLLIHYRIEPIGEIKYEALEIDNG